MTMVINKPMPRRARKKAARRARILEAAVELFGRHGIETVTIDAIANAADVGKGTIYNYFATKEAIVVAYMADVEERVQRQVGRLAAGRGSLASVLTAFVRLQLRLKRPHHAFVRVFLAELPAASPALLQHLAALQKVIDPPIETLFRRLQARGLMRRDIPMQDLVMAFKTVQLGLSMVWAIEGPPFRGTDRLIEGQMRLFCQGLEVSS